MSYNFSFIKKPEDSPENKDPRGDYRIAESCGTCRFFWYRHCRERRGYCRLTDLLDKNLNPHRLPNAKWLPTHTTAVCKKHRFKATYKLIKAIIDWTGLDLNIRGEVIGGKEDS